MKTSNNNQMNNQNSHAKANQILQILSKNKMKRAYVTLEHYPFFESFGQGSKVGNFIFGGTNDNGQQVWMNHSIDALLSSKETQVYNFQNESDDLIAEKLKISEASVRSYRNKIAQKGF